MSSLGAAGGVSPTPTRPGHLQQGRSDCPKQSPQGLGTVPEDGKYEDDPLPAGLWNRRSGQHLAEKGTKRMIS